MQKWEYEHWWTNSVIYNNDKLKEFGDEGWELISVNEILDRDHSTGRMHYYFKRPKE